MGQPLNVQIVATFDAAGVVAGARTSAEAVKGIGTAGAAAAGQLGQAQAATVSTSARMLAAIEGLTGAAGRLEAALDRLSITNDGLAARNDNVAGAATRSAAAIDQAGSAAGAAAGAVVSLAGGAGQAEAAIEATGAAAAATARQLAAVESAAVEAQAALAGMHREQAVVPAAAPLAAPLAPWQSPGGGAGLAGFGGNRAAGGDLTGTGWAGVSAIGRQAAADIEATRRLGSVGRETFEAIAAGATGAGKATGLAAWEVTNLSRQVADVGVQLGSGGSFFTTMLQQGPQIADVMGKRGIGAAVSGLAAGFMALVNPTTIALAAITALYYGASWAFAALGDDVVDVTEALDKHAEAVKALDPAYRQAIEAAKAYNRESGAVERLVVEQSARRLQEASVADIGNLFLGGVIARPSEANRDPSGTIIDLPGSDPGRLDLAKREYEPFRAAIDDLYEAWLRGQNGAVAFRRAVEEISATSPAYKRWGAELLEATSNSAKGFRESTGAIEGLAKAAQPVDTRRESIFEFQREQFLTRRLVEPRDMLAELGRARPIADPRKAVDYDPTAEGTGAAIAAERDAIELTRLRISLVGEAEAVTARQIALLEAEQRIRREGIAAGSAEAAAIMANAAAQAELASELERRGRAQATIDRGDDELAVMRARLALVGAGQAASERTIALLEAEQRIRREGIGTASAEADAIRAQVAARADLSAEIERGQAAWGEITDTGSSAIDAVTDGLREGQSAWEDWGETATDVLQDVQQMLIELAITNPAKNALFNLNLPTIGDAGGLLGRIGGAPAAPAVGSGQSAVGAAAAANDNAAAAPVVPVSVSDLPPLASQAQAADLLRRFEGFRASPYYDVNALRAGYGSDTTTDPATGAVSRIAAGTVVTPAMAEADLARRVGEFQGIASGQVGAANWQQLPTGAQAGLTSVAYNYGSLPNRILPAVRSGDTGAIAGAVEGLAGDNGGINAARRAEEAAIIRASGSLDQMATSATTGSDALGEVARGAATTAQGLTSSASGITASADELAGAAGGVASQAQGFFSSIFGAIGGALDGIGSGIASVIGSILPFERGGIMSAAGAVTLPVMAYDKGGIADRPQLAIFGEGRQREAYVPLPDGRSIPVTLQERGDGGGADLVRALAAAVAGGGGNGGGGGGGGGGKRSYHFHNFDQNVDVEESQEPDGGERIDVILDRQNARALSKSGSRTSRAFQQRYGAAHRVTRL